MPSVDPAHDHYLALQRVGRCRVLSRIGQGGMGAVYRGHHDDLDLDVAIKFLHPHLVQGGDGADRFLREGRLAARLNHPAIVRVFDCGESAGHYFIVMEFIAGESLAAAITRERRLAVPRALRLIETVAQALNDAFEQVGVIHRDVKPANILLTSAGQARLVDLGLAKIIAGQGASTAHTAAGTTLGTPAYMPPEQFANASQVDQRADIYSLGATLYHAIAGRPPFYGDTLISILKQVESDDPAPLPRSVPLPVEQLIARMMAKRPADRFQSYADLMDELRTVLESLGDSGRNSTETVIGMLPGDAPLASTAATSIPEVKTIGRVLRPAAPTETRVLLVVDIQNDFCPKGALAVPDGDAVVPIINKLARRFAHVILTQDWHRDDHLSFASSHPGKKPLERVELSYGPQILWPDHCIQGTPGAEFHPQLDIEHCELVIRKGYHREIDSYSAFFENDRETPTGLAGYLRERGLTQLFIVGLATDFCVAYSALDARRLGFDVTVIENACRGIDVDGSLAAAWQQMEAAGVLRA
ncbi:MAG: bifunctional nicotinamidase/pyrazinamidase [Planctomycetaceae bacterium]